ncbi:lytic murein transglycosylase [Cereibacter changlensis JA139]|uniref:Lytic murein transglycosylase n=3 Tax=Cereibacter changlensis TaxID=402884 RepID=A0A2T4JY91_9RHOB|nr:lytic murein transglycosylase [Cereibacter changlensis JA139]
MALAALLVTDMAKAGPVEVSPRPAARGAAMVSDTRPAEPVASPEDQAALEAWVAAFRPRAEAAGIAPATLDRAFRGLRYDADAIARDRNQAEFSRTVWDYLASAVSERRLANGRAALAEHGALLREIEARYGVDRHVVLAVWGMESSYGSHRGDHPLIGALATLAHDGRRGAFFEEQLIAALQIVQQRDVEPQAMTGSWAGAMGHTQFIPTSYLAFAVDFTGDGKRDIWSDNPADALASTAAYLAKSGWETGQPWGLEVTLPAGFDYAGSGKALRRPTAEWRGLGLRTAEGGALPEHGEAALLLPGGARGAAFLIYGNFRAISRYNAADAYVIGVGHLADRLRGGPPIRASWPEGERVLLSAERVELQELLTRAGFDTGGADGMVGPNTIRALRAWQQSVGLIPDGYASPGVLERLRSGV